MYVNSKGETVEKMPLTWWIGWAAAAPLRLPLCIVLAVMALCRPSLFYAIAACPQVKEKFWGFNTPNPFADANKDNFLADKEGGK